MRYVVVDCYPESGTDAFREFAGAAVGCWLRTDFGDDGAKVDTVVREKLLAAGWRVARTLECEDVTADTYAQRAEAREYFEQARLDGFVANFHVTARESVDATHVDARDVATALTNAAERIAQNGALSLYSSVAAQWANGVTPTGDEFVPLWLSEADASRWLEHWAGYDLRRLTPDALRAPGLLGKANDAEMWIGMGITEARLVTCHPIWLSDMLLRR